MEHLLRVEMTSQSRRRRVFGGNAARWVFVESKRTLHRREHAELWIIRHFGAIWLRCRGFLLKTKGREFRREIFGTRATLLQMWNRGRHKRATPVACSVRPFALFQSAR